MIDIIDFKEVVSLDEASEWLSNKLNDRVAVADLLDWALRKIIKISVQIHHRNIADIYNFVCHEGEQSKYEHIIFREDKAVKRALKEIEKKLSSPKTVNELPFDLDDIEHLPFGALWLNEKIYVLNTEKQPKIGHFWLGEGVYDLAIAGSGGIEIKELVNKEKGFSDIELCEIDIGYILLSEDEKTAFKIYFEHGDTSIPCSSIKNLGMADYVIRTSELKRFYEEVTGENKPIDPREKNSYLSVIYSLCKKSGIDVEKRGAIKKLSIECQAQGQDISEQTARKIIKEIKEKIL